MLCYVPCKKPKTKKRKTPTVFQRRGNFFFFITHFFILSPISSFTLYIGFIVYKTHKKCGKYLLYTYMTDYEKLKYIFTTTLIYHIIQKKGVKVKVSRHQDKHVQNNHQNNRSLSMLVNRVFCVYTFIYTFLHESLCIWIFNGAIHDSNSALQSASMGNIEWCDGN